MQQGGHCAQPALTRTLCRPVSHIIHNASSIRFDLHIQDALQQIYEPTLRLLDLAQHHMPRLRCLCYVSTSFASRLRPDGIVVQERMYPLLGPGDKELEADQLAEQLRSLPRQEAAQLVREAAAE